MGTIRQKLSAISYLHQLWKVPDPCKSFGITAALKVIVKAQPLADPKAPITLGLLHCVLEVVEMVTEGTYDAILFRAIFSTMYSGCLRVGECVFPGEDSNHALRSKQLSFTFDSMRNPTRYAISFTNFKHTSGRKVPPLLIEAEPTNRHCPVRTLYSYHVRRESDSE